MQNLFVGLDMATVWEGPFLEGQAAVFSHGSPGKDSPNEDAAALIQCGEGSGVLVVCDGAGGLPGGEQAARIAIEELVAKVQEGEDEGRTLRDMVLNGIESANRILLSLGQGAGTTIAVVEVQGTRVRTYHVGDSMILVTGQRGRIKQKTIAHSPIGFAVESGLLEETEALHHEDRHIVSNLVGTSEMSIEVGPSLDLAPYDTVLVASDGLYDNLLLEDVVDSIRKGSLGKAGQLLADRCLGRMQTPVEGHPSKPDDCTFILYRRSRVRHRP
jgi:serine/threonine protein phosphatase PrpC